VSFSICHLSLSVAGGLQSKWKMENDKWKINHLLLPLLRHVSFDCFHELISESNMPDRAAAWELLCEYTKGDSLRKHALAVETAMRACSKRYAEGPADEDEWGLVGLLHDFDYERFPSADQHPFTGSNILCGRGYSDRIIRAILGHATYTGVPRDTDMARALFATDELCGFLVACALVRPTRSLDDMEVSSVKKKLKDKAFARSVNRDDIRQGVEELGVDLDEHIRFVIDALRPVQREIGLNPTSG
jgi:predicted hydrolase (HD superfamily)